MAKRLYQYFSMLYQLGKMNAYFPKLVLPFVTAIFSPCYGDELSYETLLKCYQQPITILDLGMDDGSFSLLAMKHYDAVCVMFESPTNQIHHLIDTEDNPEFLDRLVLLKTAPSEKELMKLLKIQHFDLVLAQDTRFLPLLFELGDRVLQIKNENELFDRHYHHLPICKNIYLIEPKAASPPSPPQYHLHELLNNEELYHLRTRKSFLGNAKDFKICRS